MIRCSDKYFPLSYFKICAVLAEADMILCIVHESKSACVLDFKVDSSLESSECVDRRCRWSGVSELLFGFTILAVLALERGGNVLWISKSNFFCFLEILNRVNALWRFVVRMDWVECSSLLSRIFYDVLLLRSVKTPLSFTLKGASFQGADQNHPEREDIFRYLKSFFLSKLGKGSTIIVGFIGWELRWDGFNRMYKNVNSISLLTSLWFFS